VRDAERALHPLLRGGSQEHGLRPGTTSPSLAAATALAIELAVQEQPQRAERMASARDAFVHALALHGIEHRVLTTRASLPNTAMIAFARVDGRALLPTLDLESVCASHGSACSSGSPQPPAVLLAMGLTDAEARACVRFSFGADTTADDARDAAMRVARGVARVQKKN
jgi:cysteine desulfurase